jgi:hypothetical protein
MIAGHELTGVVGSALPPLLGRRLLRPLRLQAQRHARPARSKLAAVHSNIGKRQ